MAIESTKIIMKNAIHIKKTTKKTRLYPCRQTTSPLPFQTIFTNHLLILKTSTILVICFNGKGSSHGLGINSKGASKWLGSTWVQYLFLKRSVV